MSAEQCIICGDRTESVIESLTDTRFGASGAYDIAVCATCGLEQTVPRPSADALAALYEAHYNFGGSSPDSRYSRLRQALFNSMVYRLWLAIDGDVSFHGANAERPGQRLLDIGCNEGRGLALYRDNGFEVEGLELNRVAAEQARKHGFTVHGEAPENHRLERPYDVVVLSNVLEHALDPRRTLTQIARMLSPGGALWVSCPNSESWLRRLFGRHWINWHVPYHITHFSGPNLTRLLEESGFKVEESRVETPALWVAQSVIAALFAKPGQATTALRRPLLVIMLMIGTRGLLFPLLWLANLLGRGDCLVIRTRKV